MPVASPQLWCSKMSPDIAKYPVGDREIALGREPLISPDVGILFFLRFYLFIFREKGREAERERNSNVWLPLTWLPLGTWPATQAHAPTGNRTHNLLVPSPCWIHWATPARAGILFILVIKKTNLNVTPDYINSIFHAERVEAGLSHISAENYCLWGTRSLRRTEGCAQISGKCSCSSRRSSPCQKTPTGRKAIQRG